MQLHYKRLLMRWMLAEHEEDPTKDMHQLQCTVRQALDWAVAAWDQLPEPALRNCWRKWGVLPSAWRSEARSSEWASAVAGQPAEQPAEQPAGCYAGRPECDDQSGVWRGWPACCRLDSIGG